MNGDPAVVGYMAGAISAGFLTISLFFLKFWRRTKDGLFLSFSAAFVLLALGQAAPVLGHVPDENLSRVYLLRLAAFLLIIWAVLRKNIDARR